MVDLLEAVRHHCGDLDTTLLDRHFRRLPPIYFERYSAADIARHLRLLAGMEGEPPVDVEIRPLALHTFEVLVVGEDHAGTLACITAALAALEFNLEDVQVTTYLATERHMSFLKVGFYTVLPFIAASVGVITGGSVSDLLLRKTGSAPTRRAPRNR